MKYKNLKKLQKVFSSCINSGKLWELSEIQIKGMNDKEIPRTPDFLARQAISLKKNGLKIYFRKLEIKINLE